MVAYFANVAASGGYYIGAGAHAIVAQPTTVTGSIGVVAAHLVLSPLLAKLGVVTELVKRGARADMLSSSRPLEPGEREAMTHEIEGFYRDFVDIVAQSRKRTADEIEPLARGRVYSGLDAHRLGLVNRSGDFDTAVDIVRERLGEAGELTPWVVKPPRITPKPPAVPIPFVDALLSIAGPQAVDLLTLACAAARPRRCSPIALGISTKSQHALRLRINSAVLRRLLDAPSPFAIAPDPCRVRCVLVVVDRQRRYRR